MSAATANVGKPRLTYSSVIHSLVERLTQRSPYLQRVEETDSDHAELEDRPIALLNRNELQLGDLLGHGNFSNVYEVIGFQLENQIPSRTPRTTEEQGGIQLSRINLGKDASENDIRTGTSPVERQRRMLATKVKDNDGRRM